MLARQVALSDSPFAPRPSQLLTVKHTVRITPLTATLTRPSVSVDSKRLTPRISPLDATLTEFQGDGSSFRASDSHSPLALKLTDSCPSLQRLQKTRPRKS